MDRTKLREQLKIRRKLLSSSDQRCASTLIAQQVERLSIFMEAKTISGYVAVNHEVDPIGILERAWDLKKTCYLPIATPEKTLLFVEYFPGDPLQLNRYGIPEPIYRRERSIHPTELDLVLVPLLGFDKHNERLGSGAGFYDRTFALHTRPFMLGLAYTCQQVDALKREWWDVPMNQVISG